MLRTALLLTTLLASSVAHAAFVSTDWKVAGDNYATLHEETGKEWLDLSRTDSLTMSHVVSQLGEGGAFAGWRLPTYSEVMQLMSDFNGFAFSSSVTSATGAAYQAKATTFINTFGQTHFGGESSNGNWYAYGVFKNDSDAVVMAGARHQNSFGNRNGYIYSGHSTTITETSSNGAYGVFLVSDGGTTLSSINNPQLNINNPQAPVNTVDVSTPLTLAGFGMIGLGLLRLRRKAA